ncbi:MAG: hypothetical protein KBT39_08410, partial [Bacteroidales bacterium]|nr:hypothetical protein [Bacteroidales bacterium]
RKQQDFRLQPPRFLAQRQRQDGLSCLSARNLSPVGEILGPIGEILVKEIFLKKEISSESNKISGFSHLDFSRKRLDNQSDHYKRKLNK